MSAHHDHGHGHGHEHGHADSHDHGSFKSYIIGFVLSVILTAIPFWLVMAKVIPSSGATAAILLGFAAVQIVVHMVYFLHMNSRAEGGWNLLALLFTIMLVVIVLTGSIWVMYHLQHNMMPGMQHAPAAAGAPAAQPQPMADMP
ncbi:cytochrome o ubiquinol oxidase subunit IV [Massilia sp. TS11]|uniref:cytochrome o ubiquinol oxidase subunit IV n=1 Tax=Massilia sp. TS11 TaxID=2908003 RepID=UPI001EDAC942|nr:cytochrome o ubiquinol oxidase subunit IV [Massilia sp. TS11]MCG2583575.1 cytochrome o ubiquinol oxidase subunit IV [Massilia sp. TS11]